MNNQDKCLPLTFGLPVHIDPRILGQFADFDGDETSTFKITNSDNSKLNRKLNYKL
jgi:hypothetical protein